MKKSIIAAAATLFIAGMANAQQYTGAYDGIVKFEGEVVDQTCRVVVGSALTNNYQTVTLPKVAETAFAKAGDKAGTTPFAINLEGCKADSTTQMVKAQFVLSPNVDVDNAYTLKNTFAGGASNVNLQLANIDASQVIAIGNPTGDNVKATNLNGQETGTLRYNVQYYATAADVGPGKVTSEVEYNIVYE